MCCEKMIEELGSLSSLILITFFFNPPIAIFTLVMLGFFALPGLLIRDPKPTKPLEIPASAIMSKEVHDDMQASIARYRQRQLTGR